MLKALDVSFFNFLIPPKVKEVHSMFIPVKIIIFLHSKINIGENDRAFCSNNIETEKHLFFFFFFYSYLYKIFLGHFLVMDFPQ